jgi:putative lipoprotein
MRTITGSIELPAGVVPAQSAQMFVRVEDVSRADAPARRLGEQVLPHLVREDFARGSVAFTVAVPDPPPNTTATVRVHLDMDGDGVISRGDYVSTEHIPVLATGAASDLRVRLRRVE